jgi:putative tricarboxylic transport membrane protein
VDKPMDRISGGVVLCLAAAILWQGRGLSKGNLHAPGPGFFPTLIAATLIILSLSLIIVGNKKIEKSPFVYKQSSSRLILVFLFLLAYFFFLESLGFVVMSFLFMASLFVTVTIQKWYIALLWALVSTGLAYFLFEVLLQSNLPKGVFGL